MDTIKPGNVFTCKDVMVRRITGSNPDGAPIFGEWEPAQYQIVMVDAGLHSVLIRAVCLQDGSGLHMMGEEFVKRFLDSCA